MNLSKNYYSPKENGPSFGYSGKNYDPQKDTLVYAILESENVGL